VSVPTFSIIIPAYNRAGMLADTLASVQAQTYTSWECIVVDDGSKDNTRQVVEALSASDPRIRYVYQDNAERSAARNNGMRNAFGNYFCFLDSDDHYAPEYLERLQHFLALKEWPIALIVSDFCTWDGIEKTPVEVPSVGANVAEWLLNYPVSPSRVCMHRSIFLQFQFREDIVMVEDSVLWISIASAYPVVHLREHLVWYRVHEGNSVNRSTRAAFSRHDGLVKFFQDPLSKAIGPSLKRAMLSDVRFRMAEYHAYNGHAWRALTMVLSSWMMSPIHRHTKAKIFFILQLIPGFDRLWSIKQSYKNGR
jgi:glycosyltransferase involved in cell wall biosynthesis